jgi:glycosyl transferase family 87
MTAPMQPPSPDGLATPRPGAALERAVALGVAGLTLVLILLTLRDLLTYYPYGVDLEIPLRAAARWTSGGEPYLPESFEVIAGPDLPFLYPPLVLPFVAPLLALPRALLFPVWTALCVAAGAWACRRLAMPWWIVPIVLAWPPFAEAILGGNVQVLLFAAFTAVAWRGGGEPFRPVARDPRDSGRPAAVEGLLATLIGAVKVSQAHTWLFVLRRRPGAALLGAAIVLAVAAATVPLVGVDRWLDWFGQAGRSGDPAWQAVGMPLSILIGRGPALVVTALTLVAMFFVPVPRAGAWIGVLSVVGAPSVHIFGLLFLVPAMLEIRREIALVAALGIASYTGVGVLLGTVLVVVAFALSSRVPLFAVRGRTARAGTGPTPDRRLVDDRRRPAARATPGDPRSAP